MKIALQQRKTTEEMAGLSDTRQPAATGDEIYQEWCGIGLITIFNYRLLNWDTPKSLVVYFDHCRKNNDIMMMMMMMMMMMILMMMMTNSLRLINLQTGHSPFIERQ